MLMANETIKTSKIVKIILVVEFFITVAITAVINEMPAPNERSTDPLIIIIACAILTNINGAKVSKFALNTLRLKKLGCKIIFTITAHKKNTKPGNAVF
jgi:hypothetical protein